MRFTDITKQAGLQFKHNNGAFGAALLPFKSYERSPMSEEEMRFLIDKRNCEGTSAVRPSLPNKLSLSEAAATKA